MSNLYIYLNWQPIRHLPLGRQNWMFPGMSDRIVKCCDLKARTMVDLLSKKVKNVRLKFTTGENCQILTDTEGSFSTAYTG